MIYVVIGETQESDSYFTCERDAADFLALLRDEEPHERFRLASFKPALVQPRAIAAPSAEERLRAENASLREAARAVLDRASTHVLGDGRTCCKTCVSATLRALIEADT